MNETLFELGKKYTFEEFFFYTELAVCSPAEASKPRFLIHPISREITATGQHTNFSCQAFGIPRPVITWFKNNRSVPKDNRIQETKSLSVLTVDSVEPQDQGSYWCEANSDEGWNRSTIANLTGKLILIKISSLLNYYLQL